jgi:hypothetical protein
MRILFFIVLALAACGCAAGAGGSPDDAGPSADGGPALGSDGGVVASDARPEAASDGAGHADAVADAGPPDVDTTGPIGLAAMTSFDQLPYLRTAQRALHESSYDRTGANTDWSVAPNYLYLDDHGDKVLLDARGPGCVYRIWFTGQNPSQAIHVYFDDETTPRIDMTLGDFFSGTKAPFLAPLVAGDQTSSGGFYSDLPLPFAKAIRVTASAGKPDFYYDVDYHLFDPATKVTTWTGNEDSSAARALWSSAGADPKDESAASSASAIVSIPAGGSQTVLDVAGPREIGAIALSIAGVFPVHPVQFVDGGRAHKGTSAFTVKVDPTNRGVVLQRRLDHGIADQTATVLVDGAVAGTWTDRGSDSTDRWRDDFFQVPASLTAGKQSIHVQIVFVSSADDWNEFFYWVFSRVRGAEVLTDTLDVGDAASESAHAYAITQPTFSGAQTYTYPQPTAFAGPLNDLWIRITWDGETTPSVEAPVGAFFAQGEYGPGFVSALPGGMSRDGTMALFFPMPFEKHATIALENRSGAAIDDVWYEVLHRPFTDSFANVGAFKVAYAGDVASQKGHDALFVDVAGAGQVVGVVESMQGPPPTSPGYLEGDEHVFVDGRRTPSLQGTGTEDFFNGGWYFSKGEFTQPTHGWAGHLVTAQNDGRAMYRFLLADAIPFRTHVHFAIQHGGVDDVPVTSSLLAYYYAQPGPRMTHTDTLTVGDTASEAGHGYTVTKQTFTGSPSLTFGEPDFTPLTATGRAHKGASQFTLAVSPANHGVLLRRLLDQSVGRQAADVSVDGTPVGRWYTPWMNTTSRWRDDEFWLPEAVTAGKSAIDVTVQFVASDNDWNEFGYDAYSISR